MGSFQDYQNADDDREYYEKLRSQWNQIDEKPSTCRHSRASKFADVQSCCTIRINVLRMIEIEPDVLAPRKIDR